ncbi:MAG: endonuclease III [Thermoanaerobaculia bacterium]
MTKKEKARRIAEILDRLFPAVDIPLQHRDPFTLLVAVVLSAQTTDKLVNEVTPALFARAATPAALAALPVEEIKGLIRRIGLSETKARNLKRLSEILVAEHGGEVPRTLHELEALPGVGHKTASVVLNQGFGNATFAVDTHIHRLSARWGLSSGKNVEQTERDLKKVFPEETWGKVHLQIIYFGRQYCPALYHDLDACPICSWAASKKRKEEERRRNAGLRRR